MDEKCPGCKRGLQPRQVLSEEELGEIALLEETCNKFEGLCLKLNWGLLSERNAAETNDFLYYNEERGLAGYLGMYGFGGPVIEISGMVHPDFRKRGIFRLLLEGALKECRQRGIGKQLLICESASLSGKAFVEAVGAQYKHSEYKMILKETGYGYIRKHDINLRSAERDDIPFLSQVDALCFEISPEDAEKPYYDENLQEVNKVYVAELSGIRIGKINVFLEGEDALICAFGVLPEYRGKGYGREILGLMLGKLLPDHYKRIILEVECKNKSALNLYQAVGFEETNVYDYYELVPDLHRTTDDKG